MWVIAEKRSSMSWVRYHGPRDGKGWKNTGTGEIRYVEDMPGDDDGQSRPVKPVKFGGHIYDAGDVDAFVPRSDDDLWLYHVTTKSKAERILKSGFDGSDSGWFTKSERVGEWISAARKESSEPLAVVAVPKEFLGTMKHLDFDIQDKYGATHKLDPEASYASLSRNEAGYLWHEIGPVAEWARNLPYRTAQVAIGYAGFGYSDVNKMLRGMYQPRKIDVFVRDQTPEEMEMPQYESMFNKGLDYQPDVDGGEEYRRRDHTFYVDGVKHPHAIMKRVVDQVAIDNVRKMIDDLNKAIAEQGYVLPEDMTVYRGVYLPGVTPDHFEKMIEDEEIFEEKAFSSTMVGDAGGRRKSFGAIAKWESIYNRYPNQHISENQHEVGIAVNFSISLPSGTKVLSIEALRRLDWEFPRSDDGTRDYSKTPKAKDHQLRSKSSRSESEVLLGSGARFIIKDITKGIVHESGDPSLAPVQTYDVVMEYVGGGSSQWDL